jgi:hypothetical protein
MVIAINIVVPNYLVERWQAEYQSPSPSDPIQSITTLRKSAFDWLTLFWSAASAVGLVGTLIFTARNFSIAHETLQLAQDSRLIEAYSKAAEQLTGDTDSMAKFSALYALSRVASSSRDYHRHVIPLLCTFICRSTPRAGAESPPKEVQIAMDIIGQRITAWDEPGQILELANTNLSTLNFNRGDFTRANFARSDMMGADLSFVKASKSYFSYADLGNTKFWETDLLEADFTGATFAGAEFHGAQIRGANFQGASGYIVAPRRMFQLARNFPPDLEIREPAN